VLVSDLKSAAPLWDALFNPFISNVFGPDDPSFSHCCFEGAKLHPDKIRVLSGFGVKVKEIARHCRVT
jgi:hypothetical protein